MNKTCTSPYINFNIVFEGTVHEFEPLMVVEGLLGKPLTGFTQYSKSEFLKLLYLQCSKEFYECVATRLFPSIGGTATSKQTKHERFGKQKIIVLLPKI